MNPDSSTLWPPESPLSELQDTYWWYRARQEIIADTVQRFVPAGGRVFDCGAGSGLISKSLANLGYAVVAADVSPAALSACSRRGLSTFDLKEDWPTPGSADGVLACDVLEHVEDPVTLLKRLGRTLQPRGKLIVTVPAYDFLWSGEDYVSKHFRRYTRPVLQEQVRAAGFVVEWSSYFNALLLPLVAAYLFYQRIRHAGDRQVSDVQPLPGWQNRILHKVFAAERKLLPRFSFAAGASIILVAHLPETAMGQPGCPL